MDFEIEVSGVVNLTEYSNLSTAPDNHDYPLPFRIFATILHVLIFVFGVSGNVLTIIVARKAKSLQTNTYIYIMSLAFADALVLLSVVPEAVVFHHVGRKWLAGQLGCSLFIFCNFLGINAGSTSILAFTVERYIAIVSSPLAKQFCTIERTKKMVSIIWLVVGLYCSPWLILTEVKPDPTDPNRELCDFRYSDKPAVYMSFFAADFLLFYFLPLVVAVFVYTRIALVLRKSSRMFRSSPAGSVYVRPKQQFNTPLLCMDHGSETTTIDTHPPTAALSANTPEVPPARSGWIVQSREQVLPMLIVTVALFAVAWLPFRGLLIYNSVAEEPWLDIWYLLFAKTLIYMNSAVNPLLYNAMSKRFRVAFMRALSCKTPNSQKSSQMRSFHLASGQRELHLLRKSTTFGHIAQSPD